MSCVHALPGSASFTGKGLIGYTFGPLKHEGVEIYYVDVHKGHDTFMVSRKITRIYYVLSGTGYFTINGVRHDVEQGSLVEVQPKLEYCYSGKMTLLVFSSPRWFAGNDTFTRWNPDVTLCAAPIERDGLWIRLVRRTWFGKSPANAFLRLNRIAWDRMPARLRTTRAVRHYGKLLNRLASIQRIRSQALSTYFLRNKPELELIQKLIASRGEGEQLSAAVLGCSTGAEAYSVVWAIRSARPDVRLELDAMDISQQAIEFARKGLYSLTEAEVANTVVFERVSADELQGMFEEQNGAMSVRGWIRDGIRWLVGDAGDPELVQKLGEKDIVVANNFLCHMDPEEAERCLRNIARLVRPGGYLCVGGIDVEVRSRVAKDLSWTPVRELLEEIHEGDPSLRNDWPFHYAGLEPLSKKRSDWKMRYAAVFQVGRTTHQNPPIDENWKPEQLQEMEPAANK